MDYRPYSDNTILLLLGITFSLLFTIAGKGVIADVSGWVAVAFIVTLLVNLGAQYRFNRRGDQQDH